MDKDNSFFARNTDLYLEVIPIAPAPRMSATLTIMGDGHPWECLIGNESEYRATKSDAEALLFTWYCEARLEHDIFGMFTDTRMEVKFIKGVPLMCADMLDDGTWEVRVGYPTVTKRPNRESAIDLLRAEYDNALTAAKEQTDNALAQAVIQDADAPFLGQPLTLTIEIEAKLRTAKYRSLWQPMAEMHDDNNEQVGAVGLRQDGHILVWLKSEAVGEFEYNIGIGQLPHLLEAAVQAHHEGEPAQGTPPSDIVQAVLDELESLKQKLEPREDKIWLNPKNDALVPYNKVFKVAAQIVDEKRIELANAIIARIKRLQTNVESSEQD